MLYVGFGLVWYDLDKKCSMRNMIVLLFGLVFFLVWLSVVGFDLVLFGLVLERWVWFSLIWFGVNIRYFVWLKSLSLK